MIKRREPMTDADRHADFHELLLIEAQKLHDRECRCDPKYIRSCPKFAQAILDAGAALRKRRSIESCKASANPIDVPHTCGLEGKMYFQGNPHKHDGVACEDWAHCTRTSDEQEAQK